MFSSLPSLGGFLPSSTPSSASLDSLRFKTDRSSGLARLYTEPVPATEHRFWSSIVTHFHSAQHAFDTFSVKDARAIRDRQPRNFRTLLGLLTLHLESLKGDERFARRPGMKGEEEDGEDASTSDSAGYVAGLTAGLGKWAAAPFGSGSSSSARRPRDRTQEALNCARLLARLLPVLMEDTGVAADSKDDFFASPLEEDILWSRHTIVEDVAAASSDTPAAAPSTNLADETSDQFVIDDEDDADESKASQDPLSDPSTSSATPAQPPPAAQSRSPPLAERLIHLTLDFLFFPGFTLPHLSPDEEEEDSTSPDGSRVRHTIWSKGVGSSVSLPNTTREHIAHRVEFLRLLIVLLSKAVYVAPPAQEKFRDRALEYACTSLSRTVTLPLLCSLLNAACAEVGGGAGGWGLPGFVGGAGGAHEVEGSSEMLRTLSLQLLAVLLDWQPRSAAAANESSLDVSQQSTDSTRPDLSRTTSTATTSSTTSTLAAPTATSTTSNQFAYWLSKVHRPSDLLLLSSRLFLLLRPASSSTPSSSSSGSAFNLPSLVTSTTSAASAALGGPSTNSNSGLPSVAGIYIHAPEALTLLWRLLRLNTKFRTHVLADPIRAPTLLGLLLSHALLGKDSPPSHGMVRLAIFVLHDVSATPDPAFGEHIAAKGSQRHCELPSRVINAPGSLLAGGAGGIASATSAGDVLVACCHALVSTKGMGAGGTGGGAGAPGLALTPAILISLANLAPALRKLSVSSAAKLGQLLAHVSRPAFLLADEGNPRCCFFLLEACNAILSSGEEEVRGNANVVYALLGRGREVKRLRGFELREGLREIQEQRAKRTGEVGPLSAEEEKKRIRESEVTHTGGEGGTVDSDGGGEATSSPPAQAPAAAAATPTQLSEKAQGKVRSDGSEDVVVKPEGEAAASASTDKDPLTSPSSSSLPPQPPQPDAPSSTTTSAAPAPTPTPLDESTLLPLINSLNLYNPRTGFYPTPSWVSSWAPHLPLGPLGALHDDEGLRKELEERSKKGGADEAVRWLRSEEGVERVRGAIARGLSSSSGSDASPSPAAAPSPRPPRPFSWTPAVDVWLRSFIWGAVYVLQAHKAYCLWPDEGVRLFYLVVQGQKGGQQQQGQQVGRGRQGSGVGQGQREVGRERGEEGQGDGEGEVREGTKDEGEAQEGTVAAAGQGEASLTAEKGEAVV